MPDFSPRFLPPYWRSFFDATSLARGQGYAREGRVEVRPLQAGQQKEHMAASVRGSLAAPYFVTIDFVMESSGRWGMASTCTCPMAFACKHCAAVLFHLAGAESPAALSGPAGFQRVAPLTPEIQAWLTTLASAHQPPAPKGPGSDRIEYVLNTNQSKTAPKITINVRFRAGLQGRVRRVDAWELRTPQGLYPAMEASDRALFKAFALINHNYGLTLHLPEEEGGEMLRQLVGTGRAFWKKGTEAVSWGEPVQGELGWAEDANGWQRPGIVLPEGFWLAPMALPHYVHAASGLIGVVETPVSAAVTAAFLKAPPISPEAIPQLEQALAEKLPRAPLPSLKRIEIEVIAGLKPVPVLRLSAMILPPNPYMFYGKPIEGAAGWLSYRYGDYLLPHETRDLPAERTRLRQGSKWIEIERNVDLEDDFLDRLYSFELEEVGALFVDRDLQDWEGAFTLADQNQWIDFMGFSLPHLKAEQWEVVIDPDFPYQLIEADDFYTEAKAAGNDWFGIELGVTIDGQQVNLLPALTDYLARHRNALTPEGIELLRDQPSITLHLGGGKFLAFPTNRFTSMLGVLLELFDPKALDNKGRLKLSKLRAAELTTGPGADNWRWLGGEELRQLGERLRSFGGIQRVEPSPHLIATLRPYQQEGLNWLQFLREYELGGVLADDMGLGKTVQALAHLLAEKESGRMDRPALVIAPTSLMTNWRQEATRFAPTLRTLILHGAERKQNFEKIEEHDLVVTSYPLLVRDMEYLSTLKFHYLILDEAQYIKNSKTKYAQNACLLDARHRLCLTGTPMENHLGELWSLFNFLLPGFLGDETRFRSTFRNPIEKNNDAQRRSVLSHRVGPFVLRRKKEDVVKELPPKTEIIQNAELGGAQRDLYETIRLAMHARVQAEVSKKGMSRAHIIILDALLKLRQVCCDPRLVPLEAARKVKESAKLELLMDLLPEMVAEGRKVLLFSQFTSMLALIEKELTAREIPYVILTGQTTDRATPIERFQNGEVPVFLISLKAGGTGLNLTAADTVIHYDPWWNPAVENQATDRAHRIGQDKQVFVYKLITAGTVEEKIVAMQARKAALISGLFDGNQKEAGKLTSADLEVLFAPIG